jgi:hypothetical protein
MFRLTCVGAMKKGYIVAYLFFLPFLGCGAFTGYLSLAHFFESYQSYSWTPTPAKINKARYGEANSGDGTTVYVDAGYTYTIEGEKIRGTRVGIVDEGGFGFVFKSRAKELEHYRRNNLIFTCFVNPENPYDAVLFQAPVWDYLFFLSIFTLVFGGVGFGGMYLMFRGGKAENREDKRKQEHPVEPWLWNDDWRDGKISSNIKTSTWTMWAIAVFWNAISSPILFVFSDEWAKGNHAIIIGLLFPLVGSGLLYVAIRSSLVWWKYGRSFLELSTFPASIGGHLRGNIHLSSPLQAESEIELVLSCYKTVDTGDGSAKRLKWQSEMTVPYSGQRHGLVRDIPVDFIIPYSCKPTDDDTDVNWVLTASAPVRGVDFSSSFDVPVFKTIHSSEDITEATAFKAASKKTTPPLDPPKSIVQLNRLGGRDIELVIPSALFRMPSLTYGLLATTLVWGGVTVAIYFSEAPIIFPIVFGLFELVFVLVSLDYVFSREKVFTSEGVLKIVRTTLLGSKTTEIQATNIRKLELKNFGNSQVGTRQRIHLSLEAKLKQKLNNKSSISIVKNLGNKKVAQWILTELQKALGLSED